MDEQRTVLRHVIATIAYRAGKALRDPPPDFGSFSAGPGSRSALHILSHMADLFQWALALAEGERWWDPAEPDSWDNQLKRFYAGLAAVDERLASDEPLERDGLRLLQGPFADCLTHVGQISLLRRLAGSPVKGENYFKAGVEIGRVGPDQAPPPFEFE